jgi:N-ethylmaleimide reductase
LRLSPFGQYGGIHDSNPPHLYGAAINALDERDIAYLHLIEGRGSEIGLSDGLHEDALNNAQLFRCRFRGPLISAAAYTPSSAAQTVSEGRADAIAFGRMFIANPDFVERVLDQGLLNPYTGPPSTAAENMDTPTTLRSNRSFCEQFAAREKQ